MNDNVVPIPTQLEAVIAKIEAEYEGQKRLAALIARDSQMRFVEYMKRGFTRAEALELIKGKSA